MAVDVSIDVLVIGGGLAGLRAAQAARSQGASVLLAAKRPVGEGGASARASGGFAAATRPDDSPEQHWDDTLTGGYGVNDHDLSRIILNRAPEHLESLNEIAGDFPRDEHDVLTGAPVPAHCVARSVQLPRPMSTLLRQLREYLSSIGVQFIEGRQAASWLWDANGEVAGAILSDMSGTIACQAGAVVLAAGGCGRLFPVTSNGPDMTGDGYGLALTAGCTLRDMEFIQYTPTAFAAPDSLRGSTIVGTLLTIDGVRLVNAEGERFMERYAPDGLEGANRAVLARAIYREVAEGRGTAAGGVYLDATKVTPKEFERHRPGFFATCCEHGVDPSLQPLETAPSVHTCLGGVSVGTDLQAAPYLFAAGEALGGTHGANRLSSNSLTEANVTGWLAGKAASASARARRPMAPRDYGGQVPLQSPGSALQDLTKVMGSAAGVERSGQAIGDGLTALARLEGRVPLPMLLTAQAILHSAMMRKESRGAHCRVDHPDTDDANWLGNVYVRQGEAGLEASFRPFQPSGSSRSK